MKSRINGIAYNLKTLTNHELDALLDMAAARISSSQDDIELLKNEQNTRNQRMLDILS